eukprot:TRINITY_DN1872_c0_g1_i3.p1 TRINITY_DN1872_c0_g1~~TRINITY_DN1872_c0_g1_i3.p1  ORF type:complete len:629 (+),score=292.06 TRINITY_DN1872_c0_g1_i3:443-2329(+)
MFEKVAEETAKERKKDEDFYAKKEAADEADRRRKGNEEKPDSSAKKKQEEEEDRKRKESEDKAQKEKDTKRKEEERIAQEEKDRKDAERKKAEDAKKKREDEDRLKEEQLQEEKRLEDEKRSRAEEKKRDEEKRLQDQKRNEEKRLEDQKRDEQERTANEKRDEQERSANEKRDREDRDRKDREDRDRKDREAKEERKKQKELQLEEEKKKEESRKKKIEDEKNRTELVEKQRKEEDERREREKQKILEKQKADAERIRTRRPSSDVKDEITTQQRDQLEMNLRRDGVPLWHVLRDRKSELLAELKEIEQKLSQTKRDPLRKMATSYALEFLETLSRVLEGISPVPFSDYLAQTLDEEIDDQGNFQWNFPFGEPVELRNSEIPDSEKKLSGAAQFKRLIQEFQAVFNSTSTPKNFQLEPAVASISRDSRSNVLYAACDTARALSEKLILGLVEQLSGRALYILLRQIDSVEFILKKKFSTSLNYFYFSHFVKQQFIAVANKVAEKFKESCRAEFFCTETIYWEYVHSHNNKKDSDVSQLVAEILAGIRERVQRRTVLSLCQHFLFAFIQRDEEVDEVQDRVSSLSDVQLEDLCQMRSLRQELELREISLHEKLELYKQQEHILFGQVI